VVVQMWVAAGELLRRGADISATDNAGKTPLDAAVERMCGQETATSLAMESSVEDKVKAIRNSFRFQQLAAARRSSAEHFLSACLQTGEVTDDDASSAADSDKLMD
jgi:hypothetical protein